MYFQTATFEFLYEIKFIRVEKKKKKEKQSKFFCSYLIGKEAKKNYTVKSIEKLKLDQKNECLGQNAPIYYIYYVNSKSVFSNKKGLAWVWYVWYT